MKRAYTLLAVMAVLPLFFSCGRQEMEAPPSPKPEQTYEYRFEIGQTKATLTDEGVFWTSGDKVGLVLGSTPVEADVDVNTTPKTIVFSSQSPVSAGTTVYAYYPYRSGNTDPSATTVTIPAVQQGGSSSAMPMAGIPFQVQAGEGNNGVVFFRNLGSVIDFRIFSDKYAGEQVKSVTLSVTNGDHPISGEAKVNLTGVSAEQVPDLDWQGASATSTVKLSQSATVAASKEAAADDHLYMVVAPGTYSGTITIVTNVATYTFSFTDQSFARSALRRFNMNLNNAQRESTYVKINSASELEDGGKYLIVYESSSVAFKPILNGNTLTESNANRQSVTISEGRITATTANKMDDCQIILEKSGNNYYMKAVAAQGYYFYPSSNNITAGATKNTAVSISVNNGVVNITAGNNNYFKYSTYSNCFRHSNSNSSSELALYRLDESGLKLQSIQFSSSSFTYDISGQSLPISKVPGAPTLSGAQTTVEYSSDNTAVATVDSGTGALTLVGEGTATITATAEADDTYRSASASYLLTVSNGLYFRLENERMAAYLDYMEAHPYDPADNSISYVQQYSSTKSETNRLDLPLPVTLTWTASQTGNKSVAVYYDANHTEEEPMAYAEFSSTSKSVDIYNLIPNRHYYYVITVGNTEVASGEFNTTGQRRILKVAECPYGNPYANNCRDLGGLETTDGQMVKYGKIFRGTNLDKTTSAQQAYLKNVMNVGLDVDLRYNPVSSASSDGSYMYNGLGLDQIPATTENNNTSGTYQGHTQETYNSIDDLTKPYKMSVTLTRIINAAVNDVGVYIHCKVGADRTGFVCLMLEAILGVKQELCDVDYELTSFCKAVDGGDYRKRYDTSRSWYYYPLGVDCIKARSGATFQEKAIDYVVNVLGVPSEKITAFQNCMLEPAPVSNK